RLEGGGSNIKPPAVPPSSGAPHSRFWRARAPDPPSPFRANFAPGVSHQATARTPQIKSKQKRRTTKAHEKNKDEKTQEIEPLSDESLEEVAGGGMCSILLCSTKAATP